MNIIPVDSSHILVLEVAKIKLIKRMPKGPQEYNYNHYYALNKTLQRHNRITMPDKKYVSHISPINQSNKDSKSKKKQK